MAAKNGSKPELAVVDNDRSQAIDHFDAMHDDLRAARAIMDVAQSIFDPNNGANGDITDCLLSDRSLCELLAHGHHLLDSVEANARAAFEGNNPRKFKTENCVSG